MLLLAPLIFAFIISLIAYVAERYEGRVEKYHHQIISFNAGILIGALVLDLFPIALDGAFPSALLFLCGFCSFYMWEEFTYHNTKPRELTYKVGKIHVLSFLFASFLFGMLITFSFDLSTRLGFLLLIPIALRKITAALFGAHLMRKVSLIPLQSEVAAFSLFAGALFASLLGASDAHAFVSFLTGSLFFLAARDVLHPNRRDSIPLFLAGLALTVLTYALAKVF